MRAHGPPLAMAWFLEKEMSFFVSGLMALLCRSLSRCRRISLTSWMSWSVIYTLAASVITIFTRSRTSSWALMADRRWSTSSSRAYTRETAAAFVLVVLRMIVMFISTVCGTPAKGAVQQRLESEDVDAASVGVRSPLCGAASVSLFICSSRAGSCAREMALRTFGRAQGLGRSGPLPLEERP